MPLPPPPPPPLQSTSTLALADLSQAVYSGKLTAAFTVTVYVPSAVTCTVPSNWRNSSTSCSTTFAAGSIETSIRPRFTCVPYSVCACQVSVSPLVVTSTETEYDAGPWTRSSDSLVAPVTVSRRTSFTSVRSGTECEPPQPSIVLPSGNWNSQVTLVVGEPSL